MSITSPSNLPFRKKALAYLLDISGKQLSRFCLSRGIWKPHDTRKVISHEEAESIVDAYIKNPHITYEKKSKVKEKLNKTKQNK
jgi:hypothetical protein